MNKKTYIIIGVVLVLLVGLSVFLGIRIKNKMNLNAVENKLNDIGKKYYQEKYYSSLGDDKEAIEEFLAKYHDNGMTFDLENLKRTGNGIYQKEIDNLLNKKKLQCDNKKTKVIIYPEKPYEVNNFKIKVELDCE